LKRPSPVLSALVAGGLLLASLLAGCDGRASATPTPTGGAPAFTVVASFYPVYIAALQLTKDVPGVDVVLLAPPSTGCLHDYSLTSGDMVKLSGADVLFVNGDGMENFLTGVATDFPKLRVIEASRGIATVTGPDGAPDPHVWATPKGAAAQLANLAAGLALADPAHATLYASNESRYGALLAALDRAVEALLAPFRGAKMLAGHSSFLYFARDYGIGVLGIFGLDDGQAVGTGTLARMIDDAKAQKASLIVTDPQFPAIAGETVARETGLPLCIFDSVAGGTLTGPAARDEYLTRMDANLERLAQALEAT